MEQPVTVAASKINAETGKKRCSLGDRFRPNADPAALLALMENLATCKKIPRDTKRRMMEPNLRKIETAFRIIYFPVVCSTRLSVLSIHRLVAAQFSMLFQAGVASRDGACRRSLSTWTSED